MSRRLASIDALRGFVMIVMALDHTREAWSNIHTFEPQWVDASAFATRWITHLCAPTFVFLAGASAFLSQRPRGELARFLVTRGLWLIALEFTVVEFGFVGAREWQWDLYVRMQVIWVLGVSMIVLAALIYLPMPAIAGFGVLLVVGHNLLDSIVLDHWLWRLLHAGGEIGSRAGHGPGAWVAYPLLPWIGVMALGYASARYLSDRRVVIGAGVVLLVAFVVLRVSNAYGDPRPWSEQATTVRTILSFLDVTKYPPSLQFLCVTLGLAALLLVALSRWQVPVLGTFGRVPLFFYLIHLPLIALANDVAHEKVSLPIVFVVWILVVAALYLPCRWFAVLKDRRRDWWLGYL